MINNDVLRRIRYTFDFSDPAMIDIFALAELTVSREQLRSWLAKEGEAGFTECTDTQLASFLNGLIIKNRGKKDGEVPKPESLLTNNMILVKLRIALELKSEDILEIMDLAKSPLSKHELSALFRKPGHKHYRDCLDQFLRNFLTGLNSKYRTDK